MAMIRALVPLSQARILSSGTIDEAVMRQISALESSSSAVSVPQQHINSSSPIGHNLPSVKSGSAISMNMVTIGNSYMTPDQEISLESAAFTVTTQQLPEPPRILADSSSIYIAGIFPATPRMTSLVSAASPKVQLALRSANRGLITAVPMEDLVCGSAELSKVLERVLVVYQEVYHPQIFSPTSGTRLLFDQRRINFKIKPTVVIYQQGTVSLEYDVLNIMIPLHKQGDVEISATRPGEMGVDLPWELGSVIIVNGKADLQVKGTGRLWLIQIIWNTTVFERQR